MGMYTELHFNAELRKDVPSDVLAILNYMLEAGPGAPPPPLPEHALFKTQRWPVMLRTDSYYFAADTHSTLRHDEIGECYYLCIRCNLKNYDEEIEKFVDWIDPYLEAFEGDFLGFSRYEETETPTLIYKRLAVRTE